MRSWLAIAAVGAALVATPLWAQMRGSHAGGARPGFGHAAVAPTRGFMPRSSPRLSPMNHRTFVGGGFHSSSSNVHGGRYHHHGHRYYFSRYGYGNYGYYPGYYSYYPNYPLFGDTYDVGNDSYAQQNYQFQQELSDLTHEVQRLREEQGERTLPPPVSPAPQTQSSAVPPQSTTLVFRNGKTQTVDNYAIADGTLWLFTKQRATKIPLSQVDVAATQKANEDQGIVFQVPENRDKRP